MTSTICRSWRANIIRTIRQNIQYIAHFHTGGVAGRHELDDTRELKWRTVAKAIADLNSQGFFAHEFIPTTGRGEPFNLFSLSRELALQLSGGEPVEKMAAGDYLARVATGSGGAIVAGLGLWLMGWPPHMIWPGARRGNILNVYGSPVSPPRDGAPVDGDRAGVVPG